MSLPLMLSGCASLLNSRYQKVVINTNRGNEVYIDGKKATPKKGKYRLKRDGKAKQITVKQPGYKNQHLAVMQSKRSPLHIISWVPFSVLFFIPPSYDTGYNAFDYEKEFSVGNELIPSIPQKGKDSKEIKLNKVSLNLDAKQLKYRVSYNYKKFLKNKDNAKFKERSPDEVLKIENTIFSKVLNELLKSKGYIDTTKKVLKDSYLNNLLLEATVNDFSVSNVVSSMGGGCMLHDFNFGQLLYVNLSVQWNVLDYYKKSIYTTTTKVSSGYFKINQDNSKEILYETTKDAMELALIKLMESPKIVKLLKDKSQQKREAGFEVINIPKSDNYVSTLGQAIKSSVTVKNSRGHGSGFVISNTGHVITNYHVVAGQEGLKVVLNNEKEYKAKVLRVSKIHDLALLKIEANNLVPFKISKSKDIEIALDIYAVGTPSSEDLSQTVSKGIVSGIRKGDGHTKLIQTDASINPGNSGGAIVTKKGEVIGVVSSKLSGFGIEGVAFGIPSYEIFDKLKLNIVY